MLSRTLSTDILKIIYFILRAQCLKKRVVPPILHEYKIILSTGSRPKKKKKEGVWMKLWTRSESLSNRLQMAKYSNINLVYGVQRLVLLSEHPEVVCNDIKQACSRDCH